VRSHRVTSHRRAGGRGGGGGEGMRWWRRTSICARMPNRETDREAQGLLPGLRRPPEPLPLPCPCPGVPVPQSLPLPLLPPTCPRRG